MRKLNVARMRKAAYRNIPDRLDLFFDPMEDPDKNLRIYEMNLAVFGQQAEKKYGPNHTITVSNLGKTDPWELEHVVFEMRPNKGKVKIVNTPATPGRSSRKDAQRLHSLGRRRSG